MKGRIFFSNGTAITDEFTMSQNVTNSAPSLAVRNDGNVWGAWWSNVSPYYMKGRLFSPNGTAITDEFSMSQKSTANSPPALAVLKNGNLWGAWMNGVSPNYINGRLFFPNGTALTGEFQMSQNGTASSPALAVLNNGNVWGAWRKGVFNELCQ